MKFIINREILIEALNHVSKGMSTKTPMPVLTGIKIEAKNELIRLTTTNREISVEVILETQSDIIVESEGICVVPGKYFIEIIKRLEGPKVEFTLFEENTIKIIADRSNFTLIALDKHNFPEIVFPQSHNPIVLKSTLLRQIVKQTAFAAGVSEARVVLTGVCLEIDKQQLKVVATDSYRLARKITQIDIEHDPIQIIIPSKALEDLSRILESDDSDVSIYVESNKILFKFKNISFMTRLIEGTFPDTSSLFPTSYLAEIEFNKNDLISTVDRALVFNNADSSYTIKMVLNRDKTIQIASSSTEIGKVVDEIYPLAITGIEQFQIAFSSKHILDALKAIESQEVTLKLTGEIKPFIITGKSDDDLVQLILPVRSF